MKKEEFTQKLQSWLDTPKGERDLQEGALLLLALTNNRVLYANCMRNLQRNADLIEYKLKRYLNYRVQEITHEQVTKMAKAVDKIADEHKLTDTKTEFKVGKREDHDKLPIEIQALYEENYSLMQRMKELHLKLRTLSGNEATCPDSDRYPFLKEIIELDKKYHGNWKEYDSYTNSAEQAEKRIVEDIKERQKKLLRQLNLLKGQYKKSPTEEKKMKIINIYTQLTNPSEKLISDLRTLGILKK